MSDMEELKPKALAESGDPELDERPEVQEVTPRMILDYVLDQEFLPLESAQPFTEWLHDEWFSFNEGGRCTNGDVIDGALDQWCGGRVRPTE